MEEDNECNRTDISRLRRGCGSVEENTANTGREVKHPREGDPALPSLTSHQLTPLSDVLLDGGSSTMVSYEVLFLKNASFHGQRERMRDVALGLQAYS